MSPNPRSPRKRRRKKERKKIKHQSTFHLTIERLEYYLWAKAPLYGWIAPIAGWMMKRLVSTRHPGIDTHVNTQKNVNMTKIHVYSSTKFSSWKYPGVYRYPALPLQRLDNELAIVFTVRYPIRWSIMSVIFILVHNDHSMPLHIRDLF